MSCGAVHRRDSDPLLLWLWYTLAAAAPIQPPSLGTSICQECNAKKQKQTNKQKTKKRKTTNKINHPASIFILDHRRLLNFPPPYRAFLDIAQHRIDIENPIPDEENKSILLQH